MKGAKGKTRRWCNVLGERPGAANGRLLGEWYQQCLGWDFSKFRCLLRSWRTGAGLTTEAVGMVSVSEKR
jgi:hypothetical protein